MTQKESVLLEVATAANTAGLDAVAAALRGLTSPLAIAGEVIGLTVAAAKSSIDAYTTLGDAVENYSRVTGASAETSSRMVETFQALGVNVDEANTRMGMFTKNVDLHADKLKADGLVVATTAQGNVNMSETLYNLADAYNATTDPTKRAVLLSDAFGKSGASMIPILEKGSAALRAYAASAGLVFTADDLARLKQYKLDQAELSQNTEEFKASIGQGLVPALDNQVRGFNRITEAQNLMAAAGVRMVAGPGGGLQLKYWEDLADANYKAKQAFAATTQEMKDQAQGLADLEAEQQREFDIVNANVDASFAYRQAQIDLGKAISDAKDAKGQDVEANLREEEAYRRLGVAAGNLAVQQLGPSATAAEQLTAKNNAQIKSYEALQKTLTPGSPLYIMLQNWINALAQVPHEVDTTVKFRGINAAGGGVHGNLSFDQGGVVPGPPGQPVMVQALGGEEFGGRRGLGGGGDIHVHVHGGLYADGPGLDRFTNAIAQRLRMVRGY